MKHKFKREKRWLYKVISRCEHCKLQREKIYGNFEGKDHIYVYGEFGSQKEIDPGCSLPPNHEPNTQN